MDFPNSFIRAGKETCSLDHFVPAPYFRKTFAIKSQKQLNSAAEASVVLCGLGFYELYINGKNITKGLLAPYISNPDDLIYYDAYDILPYLKKGENVLGVCLGNGLQNAFGAYCWDFQKAKWRAAAAACAALYDQIPGRRSHGNRKRRILQNGALSHSFRRPSLRRVL